MRDFRDAKAMAHSLREALAAKDLRVSNSESHELISKALGVSDWNTLSAAIQSGVPQPTSDRPAPIMGVAPDTDVPYSKEMVATLGRAKLHAEQQGHYFLTIEHVLMALIDDPAGSATLLTCSVDREALSASLTKYVENDLRPLSDLEKLKRDIPDFDPKTLDHRPPTAGLIRVMHLAKRRAALARRPAVSGSDVLLAIFLNAGDAHSAVLLEAHGMTRRSALAVLGVPEGS